MSFRAYIYRELFLTAVKKFCENLSKCFCKKNRTAFEIFKDFLDIVI